jgi:hypothetical protein
MGEEIAYRCRDFIGVSLSLRNDRYRRQVTTQLVQLRIELATVMEKLNASADILKRTVIESPLAGTVLNMRFKTEGGVLKATEPILDCSGRRHADDRCQVLANGHRRCAGRAYG